MTRLERLEPVQQFIDANERQRAENLAVGERRVAECEQRLGELVRYEADYRESYRQRVSGGMASVELRDYQAFLARLAEAVRQQAQVVATAKLDRDARRHQWQEAARRAKAVDHVVDNWRAEEQRAVARREQRETDERAQRKPAQHD